MITGGRTLASVGLLAWVWSAAWAWPAPPPKADAPAVRTVTGPFTHGNLFVFAARVRRAPGRQHPHLQDAFTQKKAIVRATSTSINCPSRTRPRTRCCSFESGDIVKGGEQDRAIAFDMLLPPKSGLVNVGSFCCESGRWKQRRRPRRPGLRRVERPDRAGKDLKAAVIADDSSKQGEVWTKVGETQEKPSRNVVASVADPASPSSLQLALDNKRVQDG